MNEDVPREESRPIRAAVVPRRRWRRRLVAGGLLLAAAAAALVVYLRAPKRLDCEAATHRGERGSTVIDICREEYKRTGLPATGVRLVEALLRAGDRTGARTLASELLTTEALPDALYLLGQLEFMEGRTSKAVEHWQEARRLHRANNQRAALARDAMGLAGVNQQRNQLAEALYSLDECITESQAAEERTIEGKCRLAAARTLLAIGQFNQARQEIDHAERLLSSDTELARLWLERGNVEQEVSRGQDHASHGEQAVAAFEKALWFAQRARLTNLVVPIELNLVFSLAELNRTPDAERHLKIAAEMDLDREYESERAQLEARIAYRRGSLELASALNTRLYEAMPPGDDRFEVCVMQARIALARNNIEAAEQWARRGIDEVEKIRAAQVAVELRSWVLASRRAPYELLFTVLTRTGRSEEALRTFDQWQGRALLDMMARPRHATSPDLAATAGQIQKLGQWLPMASTAPLVSPGSRGGAEVLRSLDLLALAVAEGDVWRVVARRGQLRIEKLGSYSKLADQLDRFVVAPTDRALAGEIGKLLAPAELFRDGSTLHVLLDAPLAALPIAALRHDGKALIAARPVLRISRLPAQAAAACDAPSPAGGATVLADAEGNLPDARTESRAVAALLKTTAHVGSEATSSTLFAAKPGSILHVAVHAGIDTGGGVLRLHDRQVSALEIMVTKLGPSLAVLSGCSTSRSTDPEVAGSLSTAFLANGSSQVIATLRPVSDTGALGITSRFYQRGGIADPVRTLAAIQAELAERDDNKDWPNFAVFGNDACTPGGSVGPR